MIAHYTRRLDYYDFDISSLRPDRDVCCMERPLEYCWLMSFLSMRLEQFDFDVCLPQAHTDSWARVLLSWHNVKVFTVCDPERTQYYVGVDALDWRAVHGHRFSLIPTVPVLTLQWTF